MRTFVAVVPPPEALAPLVTLLAALRAEHPDGVTWVPPERLHVTLAFLGDVSEETAARVGGRLDEVAATTATFELRIEGGGAFPRAARPRVLWAGVEGEVDALASLARDTRRAARAAHVAVERAPYVPHVTVARVRRGTFAAGPAVVDALAAVRGAPWPVGDFVLMQSLLGPKPSYERLDQWRLKP